MSFTFVHASDLHLDTPFEGLARVRPSLADALREASLRAFDRLVSLALSSRADALLIAGDLYDGPERGVRAQIRLLGGVRRLSEAGCAVFIVHGNHDPLDGWSAIDAWPPGVSVFGSASPEAVALTRDGETLAFVHGMSYPTREVRENLAARFVRAPSDLFQFGLVHANVGGQPGHAAYAPCSVDDLVRSGLDYWALGHVHTRAVLRSGDPWVVYPGNLQGRHPGETGAKGAMIGRVDARTVTSLEFAALDQVRFSRVDVDVSGARDVGALHDAAAAAGMRAMAEADGRPVMLRARLTGRDDAARAALAHPRALEGLVEALREEGLAEEPFLWWDALEDGTRPTIDRVGLAAREGPSVAAEIARRAAALSADPALLAGWIADMQGAVPPRLSPFAPDAAAVHGLAEQAAERLLEALEEGSA